MPNYLSPGVYVEEVSSGVKPIAGVGTSIGGFVGLAQKGTRLQPVLVTNWTQFVKEFGDFITSSYLAYSVYGFFAEGGTSCYVVNVIGADAKKAEITIKNNATSPVDCIKVEAISAGTWGNELSVVITEASSSQELSQLTVQYGKKKEVYDEISLENIATKINNVSELISIEVLDGASGKLAIGKYQLNEGNDGILAFREGLTALDICEDVNIIAVPDQAGERNFILEALNYCRNRKDCFFVADAPQNKKPQEIVTFRSGINSSYGALYYPWVTINDPLTDTNKLVPPSGVVAGTYAYTDATRGVHKAPAGITDGYLDSVVGVERILTKGENDLLNPEGINAIRSLPAGICIWGTRTLSADTEWQYLNIRRLFLYLKKSIDQGLQWVIFEPNDPALWGKVKRNITAFLTQVWREGALYGSIAEEAFYVKVDEENNPPETRDAGKLFIEVAVAPIKPAEFVVLRISQKTLTK